MGISNRYDSTTTNSSYSSSGIQLWAQVASDSLFDYYRIESANQNEIYLEMTAEDFVKVFRSGQSNYSETIMRLTKRDRFPILSFDIKAQSRNGKTVQLTQMVPVKVYTAAEAQEIREPMVPEPEVHIMMPNMLTVKTIMDKLKALSTSVTVSANMNGELRFQVESDYALVDTFFNELENPELDPTQIDPNQPSLVRDKLEFASVRLDTRDLMKFTHCHLMTPKNVVCCLIENHGAVFYVYLGDATEDTEHVGLLTYC